MGSGSDPGDGVCNGEDNARRRFGSMTGRLGNEAHLRGAGETHPEIGRVTVIEPAKGWCRVDLRELWSYRELLGVLVMRDIKVRYKQTSLGVLWVVLQPLASTVIFTLIFGKLAKIPSEGYPYTLFVYSALLPWTYFANAVSSCGNSLVGSAGLIGKTYFPRIIIPIAAVGAGLVDFAVSAAVLLLLLAAFGVGWSANLLAAPFLVGAVVFTALGTGILLSALVVSYRDFRNVIPFLLQIWLYTTPIIYPTGLIPERWQWVLYANPMAGLVEGFRSVFLDKPFDPAALGASFAGAILLFLAGVLYFEKVERSFADII